MFRSGAERGSSSYGPPTLNGGEFKLTIPMYGGIAYVESVVPVRHTIENRFSDWLLGIFSRMLIQVTGMLPPRRVKTCKEVSMDLLRVRQATRLS